MTGEKNNKKISDENDIVSDIVAENIPPDSETDGNETVFEGTDEEETAKDKLKKLRNQLEECRKEKDEYLAGWQRAKADFINARKDEEKRREEFIKMSNRFIMEDILNVLDSFDIALKETSSGEKQANEEISATLKGFRLIKSQLDDILKKYGLELIKTDGEKFDPSRHEAIDEEKTDKDSGIITETYRKGYMINGTVVRPAKVKVSK